MKSIEDKHYSMGEIIRTFHQIKEFGIFKDATFQGQT